MREIFLRCRAALRFSEPTFFPKYPPTPAMHPLADSYAHAARVWAKKNTQMAPSDFVEQYYHWIKGTHFDDLSHFGEYFAVDTESMFMALLLVASGVDGGYSIGQARAYIRSQLLPEHARAHWGELGGDRHKEVHYVVVWKAEQFYAWARNQKLGRILDPSE